MAGQVNGTDRIVLEHYTRTTPTSARTGPPRRGDGCYRILLSGEPHMAVEFTHHGERGDHNVSGMIVTAARLVNSVAAVVDAKPGLITALDLRSSRVGPGRVMIVWSPDPFETRSAPSSRDCSQGSRCRAATKHLLIPEADAAAFGLLSCCRDHAS